MATNAIKTISFSRLRNAHHLGYHSKVLEEIDKYKYDTLGIDDELYARYKSAINIEQDIVNRSRASEQTVRMKEIDAKRDDLFRKCIYLLKAAVYGTPTETITADVISALQTKILDLYPVTIADGGSQEETAKIRGFIKDMNLSFSEILTDLKVESSLTELETVNDSFETVFMERIREQSAAVNSSESRGDCDDAYWQITFYLNSMANIVTTTTELLVKQKLCNKVVDEINTLISVYQSYYYSKPGATEDPTDAATDASADTEVAEKEKNPES